MKSIKQVYKTGVGPSSSHTMGPCRAAEIFKSENPDADKIRVILYGSLSKTGKGHGTDTAISKVLGEFETEIVFSDSDKTLPHENTLDFIAYKNGAETAKMRVMSIGGGNISIEGRPDAKEKEVYKEGSFEEIKKICSKRGIGISEYVYENEGGEIRAFLRSVWVRMKQSIENGLSAKGILPGGLEVERKAGFLYSQRHIDESPETRENRIISSYAFALSEENAAGGVIVTAPTCGSCGVLPSVLRYVQEKRGFSDDEICDALATAGIIGNLVIENASVSGAECGCQAEIGTACSMAAAALSELYKMNIEQTEYSAEVALEHHLGLTCDPVCGLVQIPCIERNAVAAMRAVNAVILANFLTYTRKVSFDTIVRTMYETGKDLSVKYRETSEGGLAKLYKKNKKLYK